MKNENPTIEFDHIGIAMPDIESGSAFWRALGWNPNSNTEVIDDQKVKVAMLPLKNSSNVELLEPTGDDSPVAKFLAKRGPGIHHVCFRVVDIEGVLKRLKSAGVRLINETP